MSGHLCLKWNNHSTAFIKSISNIQIKERYCDATIACQGKYFPVHRVVLSTCSDYFDEMFERIQCQHPYIVFKDIDPKEMELLLNYMYQGEVNVIQENLPTLIKAAEALKVKGLAVPDDLPNKESSGRKRGNTSNDLPVPKRRSEEKRRRRYSSDQTAQPSTSSSIQDREKLNDNIETIESKVIKDEPLDTGYNDPPHSTDYGEAAYTGNDLDILDQNQTGASDKVEGHFGNFPVTEETNSFVKQEQPETVPTETFNDEQSSSWSDFASSDIMQDLPPETSTQDDVSERHLNYGTSHPYSCENSIKQFDLSSRVLSSKFQNQQCPYCDYKSPIASNVQRHIRFRHTQERPYQCSVCLRRFTENNNLQVHMRVHTGEKPFECSVCSKKFGHSPSLNKHMKSCHGLG